MAIATRDERELATSIDSRLVEEAKDFALDAMSFLQSRLDRVCKILCKLNSVNFFFVILNFIILVLKLELASSKFLYSKCIRSLKGF